MCSGLRRSTFAELIDRGILEIGDGYRAKNAELGGQGPIFLRAGKVRPTHIDFSDVERFYESLAEKVAPKSSREGDVVVTTKGNSTGRVSFVTADMPRFIYSPHLSYWRSLDREELRPGFLRYWSMSREFRNQLAGLAASTDMAPYLSLVDQKRLRITMPSPGVQQRIAHILGTLDDKIELNRRMNQTLEAIARAIFKSWFIDFLPVRAKIAARTQTGDPVHAKSEGREPVGMDPETAALFPSSFQPACAANAAAGRDSPLGKIPKGWEASTLGAICEKPQYGYTQSATEEQMGPRFLRIKDINKQPWIKWSSVPYCEIGADDYEKYRLGVGDIVIARIADPGHGALIETDMDAVFASYLIRFRLLDRSYSQYVKYWLRSPGYWALVRARRSGSTRGNLNAKVLSGFPILIPPARLAEKFQTAIRPLAEKTSALLTENEELGAIRDALLPRLLSGELAATKGAQA